MYLTSYSVFHKAKEVLFGENLTLQKTESVM